MHTFTGDLLIGGMKLSHVEGELETERHDVTSHDWILSGKIVLAPLDTGCLELGRQYRLELTDGRASQVVLSRLELLDDEHIIANFVPMDLSGEKLTPTQTAAPVGG